MSLQVDLDAEIARARSNMSTLGALKSERPKLPDSTDIQKEIEEQARIWKWREPVPFDVFAEMLDGCPLYPRQRKVLSDARLLRAYNLIRPDRSLQQMVLMWGKGCVSAETLLTDVRTNETRTVEQWERSARPLYVWAEHRRRGLIDASASAVFVKGTGKLISVTVGLRTVHVSENHCFLSLDLLQSRSVWKPAADLIKFDAVWTDTGWGLVNEISPAGEGDLYDINVPGAECYYDANGILHHNSGKDYLAAKMVAYGALVANNIQGDVPQFLGLAPETALTVLNIAPNEDLAKKVFFAYLRRFLSNKMFRRFGPDILTSEINFYTDDEKRRARRERQRPNPWLQLLSRHSKSSGLDGFNLFMWVMDEADAFLDSSEHSNAEEIWNILVSSCNTRLLSRWLGFIISYPRVEGGFMERRLAEALKEMADLGALATMFGDRAATWEVNTRVTRDSPSIVAHYRRAPQEANALYGCVPMSAACAFFEMADQITLAVNSNLYPCAEWEVVPLDLPDRDGNMRHYVKLVVRNIVRQPGYTYFLGADAGRTKDSYAISIVHVDDNPDAAEWVCPDCAERTPEYLSLGEYKRVSSGTIEERPPGRPIACGMCYTEALPAPWRGTATIGYTHQAVQFWYKRTDRSESYFFAADGKQYRLGTIYEDLLIRVQPSFAIRPGEFNRPIYFPAIQEACRDLINGLNIVRSRFDPWQTTEVTQGLIQTTGADVGEISFQNAEQYRRGRLVKSLTYASLINLLPGYEIRDREWRQLMLINGTKLDHPEGGSKDMWDAEAVAIWLAATYRDSRLEALFI